MKSQVSIHSTSPLFCCLSETDYVELLYMHPLLTSLHNFNMTVINWWQDKKHFTYNWARNTPEAFRTRLARWSLRTNGTCLSLGTFQARLSLSDKNRIHKPFDSCSFVVVFLHCWYKVCIICWMCYLGSLLSLSSFRSCCSRGALF